MSDKQFPLISDALVRIGGTPGDKASAIREVGELLRSAGYVDPPYVASMAEREKAADTFLGAGVAIPHGKVEDKNCVRHDGIAVLQVPAGVEWNAGQTVKLVVGIAARSDGHLAILKRLTRLIQDEERITLLSSTDSAAEIVSALSEERGAEDAKPAEAGDLEVRDEWVIDYPSGLHARPASLWVNAAKALDGPLRLRRGSDTADPRNLLSLLQLGIKSGETIVISASGEKAKTAVRRMKEVMTGLSAQEKEDFERAARKAAEAVSPRNAWVPPSGKPALKGVSASPGLATGTIVRIGARMTEVEDEPASLEESARLLESAIDRARRQLEAVIEETVRRLGQNEAAIFRAHLGILEDTRLLTLASRTIVAGHGAAWAWNHAVETLADELASIDNQLLAARAADMRDVGRRVLSALREGEGEESPSPAGTPDSPVVIVAEDLSPSDTAGLDRERVAGLVTALGGPTSHTAIIARTLGLPAVVALGRGLLDKPASTAIVDGDTGRVWLDPTEEDLSAARERMRALREREEAERAARMEPGSTSDGRIIAVAANVNRPSQVAEAIDMGCEGVGLMRTEFLFLERDTTPTEDEQYEIYRAMLSALGGRPLIVRALDIGGDKRVPHLNLPHEENPFLGVRGVRLLLRRPELLYPQVRALYRAAVEGDGLSVMFPMVGTLEEIRRFRAVCEEVRASLDAPRIPLGIMVEVPAAALLAEEYAPEVDFFSIGTNDLTQYTLAIDRQNPELAASADSLHPAVLRLVRRTVEGAEKHGKWVGICGGIAGDPFGASLLVGLGVTELSMTPRDIPAVKARLRANDYAKLRALAERALEQDSAEAVRRLDREAQG